MTDQFHSLRKIRQFLSEFQSVLDELRITKVTVTQSDGTVVEFEFDRLGHLSGILGEEIFDRIKYPEITYGRRFNPPITKTIVNPPISKTIANPPIPKTIDPLMDNWGKITKEYRG